MEPLDIIERLKVKAGAFNEKQLAERLGLPVSTLYAWIKRGRIPPGGIARIAVAIGRSVEWVRTGQPSPLEAATQVAEALEATEGLPPALRQQIGRLEPLTRAVEGFLDADFGAIDLLIALMPYIKDAPREERETLRRVVEGLQSGGRDVRTHLITQLKLIVELIERRKADERGRSADDPPDCAAAG
jgi:hypothetical protein